MSLLVRLKRFRAPKTKSDKYARLVFRGFSQVTEAFAGVNEINCVNQMFKWTVLPGAPLVSGEILEVQLMLKNRWGPSTVIGVNKLDINIVVEQGYVNVIDSLFDTRNCPIQAFIDMELYYNAPDGTKCPGSIRRHSQMHVTDSTPSLELVPGVEFGPAEMLAEMTEVAEGAEGAVGRPASDTSNSSSAATSDAEGDVGDLDRIERQIANYERIITGKRCGAPDNADSNADETEAPPPAAAAAPAEANGFRNVGKLLFKQVFKRGFSMGGWDDTATTSVPATSRKRYVMPRSRAVAAAGAAGGTRFAERFLLSPRVGSSHDADYCPFADAERASASSEDPPAPARAAPTTRRTKPSAELGCGSSLLKASDFQVRVAIIEAQQLSGLDINPVVCVQVGDQRKYTSVKENSNCPFYDEYFVFDFHMPPLILLEKKIFISVLHSQVLRTNKLLGTFKLDVATVWSQPDRQFNHKWAVLTDPDDFGDNIKGYVKCDISVIGKGEAVKIPPKTEKDDNDIEAV